MKIALVAMPWPQFDAPSGALGSLSAYMRRERPDHEVTCVYAYVELWRRMESVYESSSASLHAELMYLPLLYPESRQRVREFLVGQRRRWCMADDDAEAGAMFDAMLEAEEQHAAEVARALTGFDVIGFTVTYAQLHSSLVVARALRRLGCEATIVLGGAGVDAGCGPSVMAQHPEVDLVVQGEGERTVVDLVDALDRGEPVDLPGVITRQTDLSAWSFSPAQRLANQVEDLDSLPVPEYAEYAELAEELSIFWIISTETSRGCWWNRALTTGDPLKACYFCNLNMGSYREKSVARAAGEIRALVQGHGNVRLRLMDNVMRNRGLPEIFDALAEPPMDLRFSTEVRASIRPYDLMRMWEAGCHHVQIGVEGLSTAYLKRLGKGATTIQNLQALKTCFELDLHSTSNLLTHFPGATAEEVDETVRNLEAYATGYHPTSVSRFTLFNNSAVCLEPGHFGLTNLRNQDSMAALLPPEVAAEAHLFQRDYDVDSGEAADWGPVEQAVERWSELHDNLPRLRTFTDRPFYYTDGGTFLEIVDRRDDFRLITLEELWREVYLHCMEIRGIDGVIQRFAPVEGEAEVQNILDALCEERLMYREGKRSLSLAPAVHPVVAARRIRRAHQQAQ